MRIATKVQVLAVGLVLATAGMIGLATGWGYRKLVSEELDDSVRRQLALEARRLDSAFLELAHDTRFLAGLPLARDIASRTAKGEDGPKAELAGLYLQIAQAKRAYVQVRLLDATGRELVRVHRTAGGVPVRVPDRDLQDKGGRSYVTEPLAHPGETYFSPIDLNREHGRIEVPHLPVMRAARAVLAADGTPTGLVVVNLDFEAFLHALFSKSPPAIHHYVANADGDWLHHPNPALTFGFDLGERHRAGDADPGVGALFDRAGGAAGPIATSPDSAFGRAAFQRVFAFPGDPGRYVVLGVAGRFPSAASDTNAILLRSLTAAAGLVAVALVLAWWTSRRLTRPLAALTAASDALEGGAREVELPVGPGDEIGTLARAFEGMVRSVRDGEDRLRETNRSLAATNRELEAFVYSASHDLRAPLRSMLGLVDLAIDELADGDPANASATYLPTIRRNVERLDRLVVDLLAVSRADRDPISLEPVDVAELVRSTFESLFPIDGAEHVDLRADVELDGPIPLDRSRVGQVLANLVANAIQYRSPSRERGSVRVTARARDGRLELRVSDDGVGIPAEFGDRVFDMFARADERGTGSGLGLYLVRKHVQFLGGSIDYTSGEAGTEFRVVLPSSP